MPCRSDYLQRDTRETESRLVIDLLVYVRDSLGSNLEEVYSRRDQPRYPPDYINQWEVKSDPYYGLVGGLDQQTAMLCLLICNMTDDEREKILYNAHSKQSRQLADWWEKHQEADRKREQMEEDRRKAELERIEEARELLRAVGELP